MNELDVLVKMDKLFGEVNDVYLSMNTTNPRHKFFVEASDTLHIAMGDMVRIYLQSFE